MPRRRATQVQDHEAHETQQAAAAMALMFLVGGLTTLLAAVVSRTSEVPTGLLYVIGLASPCAAALLWWKRRRLPRRLHPWLVALGTGLVTLLMAKSGSAAVVEAFSFYFTWIVLFALLFMRPRQVIFQLLLVAVGYLVGATAHPGGLAALAPVEPLVLLSVLGTFALVVGMLSRARQDSEIDPLTQVLNRRGMEREIRVAVREAAAASRELVLALIDVDHFKVVNDRRGHLAGDQVLQDLTDTWRRSLRSHDLLCRVGGDEFVALLPGCAPAEATGILRRLREDERLGVTCSIGAASWHEGESPAALLGRADGALYDAKHRGRNQVAWADGERRVAQLPPPRSPVDG